jgi:hypothetical protein
MAEAPIVTFLIGGVQKGGTTALYDYLRETPEVALSRTKEPHFFDDDARDWASPDYAAYHAQFDDPSGRPSGEATPIYLYWPNCLERIAAYNPAMRLILALRDPVERAWSHWRMEYARGAEALPFARAVREGRMRLFDGEPWGFHREWSYVERGFYGEQIERLFAIFPREQVLILKSEDLRADPGPAMAKLRAFIGLPPAPPPAPRASNVGVEMDYSAELSPEDAAFLRGLYAKDDARLKALTGIGFG